MVSPVKLTQSAGCPKRVGSQVPRGPALLLRSLQGVFPHIKLTTSGVVLIKAINHWPAQHVWTYSQQIETSSQLEGSGTTLRAEGNLVYFKTENKSVRLITISTLTRPLSRSLRGRFICQIEILKLKSNLTVVFKRALIRYFNLCWKGKSKKPNLNTHHTANPLGEGCNWALWGPLLFCFLLQLRNWNLFWNFWILVQWINFQKMTTKGSGKVLVFKGSILG